MKKNLRQFFLLAVILMTFSLSACSSVEEHIWLKSLGWSRGLLLGETAYKDPVPIAITQSGEQFFLLVERDELGDSSYFRVKAFSPDAELLWDQRLDELDLDAPEAIQLFWLQEELHLFWIDDQQLYTLTMDARGNLLDDPTLLSGSDVVGSFSVAVGAGEEPILFYAGTTHTPGVYALTSFDESQPKRTVDPDGVRVQVRYGQDGRLHAGWLRYPPGYGTSQIVYADSLQEDGWDIADAVVVHEIATGPSNVIEGPVFGVDEGDIYFFWSVTIRSGLEAGKITAEYLSFSHADGRLAGRPEALTMPALSTSLTQEEFADGVLLAGERVDLRNGGLPRTPDVQEIGVDRRVTGELAFAFQSSTQHLWRKAKKQVNVAYFAEGQPTSYQPLSYTTTISSTPFIISDESGYVYITWLEKLETDRYTVYFASTSPNIEVALGRSSADEILRVLGEVVFGMLVGILMAPITGAVWMLAPVLVLVITSPLRKLSSERVRKMMVFASLILAIAAYWASKFAVLPGISSYVPFSAWVPEMPLLLGNFLQWFVPIVFSLFALIVAWHYTFRQSNESTLYFLLVYIGVDALLTSSVYAVLIFGGI